MSICFRLLLTFIYIYMYICLDKLGVCTMLLGSNTLLICMSPVCLNCMYVRVICSIRSVKILYTCLYWYVYYVILPLGDTHVSYLVEKFGTMHVFCIVNLQFVLYGWTHLSTCIYLVWLDTLLVLKGWTIMLNCMYPVWLFIQVCNLSYMVGHMFGNMLHVICPIWLDTFFYMFM